MNRQTQIKRISSLAFKQALLSLSVILFSLNSHGTTLTSVDYSSLPGDKVELRFGFDQKPPTPKGYNIEKPARIALDLEGVKSGLRSKYHELGLGNARNLAVIEAGNRTRLIINLTEMDSYNTRVSGNNLVLILGEESNQSSAAAQTQTIAARPFTKEKVVQGVDFKRGIEGEGKVIIDLADPNVGVDMRKEGGKIFVRFHNTKLPDDLIQRLDVIDFGTPVKEIDSTNEDGGALITIRPHGAYEHLAYQTDNTYVVSIKPMSQEEQEKKKKKAFSYTGEKLSLNFQDIEVRSVLQLIADFTELNLVASDTVSGKITLRLQNVPWDQALDLILKTKGLDKRKVGNVMLVAPADEIAAREKLELEATRQVAALAPTQSEFFTIKYAAAEDIKEFLTGEGSKLNSDRGSVVLDSRTNTLLIQDTAKRLEEIREVIATLDVPVRQVLIEARVVVASSNISDEIGVRWGGLGRSGNPAQPNLVSGQISDVFGNNGTFGNLSDITSGDPVTLDFGQEGSGYVVDFGASDPNATSIAVGIVGDGLLEVELSAIEAEGDAEIISTPKVLTADSQEAEILSGQKVPIRVATSSGATAVSYIDAVLGLKVTPHITPDDRILMDLELSQDSIATFSPQGDPIIDVNQILTHVLVGNGETIVLGGVFQTTDSEQIFKTPFFGDLPIVGILFRRSISTNEKQELLVFVTPKIVEDLLANN